MEFSMATHNKVATINCLIIGQKMTVLFSKYGGRYFFESQTRWSPTFVLAPKILFWAETWARIWASFRPFYGF